VSASFLLVYCFKKLNFFRCKASYRISACCIRRPGRRQWVAVVPGSPVATYIQYCIKKNGSLCGFCPPLLRNPDDGPGVDTFPRLPLTMFLSRTDLRKLWLMATFTWHPHQLARTSSPTTVSRLGNASLTRVAAALNNRWYTV